jgi:hypothetical protein
MSERIKYLIALVILVLIGAGWIYFLLDRHIYPVNLNDPHLEQRIAFVSLWVAIVGFSLAVLGTVLAVLQFQASQRTPDLYLWLDNVGQTKVTIAPGDEGIVSLIVQNKGTRVARFVHCVVLFHTPPRLGGFEELPIQFRRVSLWPDSAVYPQNNWRLGYAGQTEVATFVSGEDYIIYDEELGVNLGVFLVNLIGADKGQYEIEYELRCEGMESKDGHLWLEVPEDASSLASVQR